ncbi:DUF805 domain-containing protein [Sphingomicrobium arenosum]|uniref:DUF805 domain-containing protein n=1 Tax=Sphingomicrobium arenosum TaxID=2233861 RepID=UPI002240BDC0|nr:DUF805 domain-containing protein [Sphingomicrobium arenosum]
MQGNKVSFGEHFRLLFEFSGREDRSSFWAYAAAVFGLSMVLTMLAMLAPMFASMRSMQNYAEAHPESVTISHGPGHYSMSVQGGEFSPDFTLMFLAMGMVVLVAIVLLAAAVVRRLHDTGRSGWWGLMPVPFIAFSMIAMPQVFSPGRTPSAPDPGLFMAIFLSNMFYMLALLALVVLLALKSTDGPNRFGAAGAAAT